MFDDDYLFSEKTIKASKITVNMESINKLFMNPTYSLTSKICCDESDETVKIRLTCKRRGNIHKSAVKNIKRSYKVLVSNIITGERIKNYHKQILLSKVFKSDINEYYSNNFVAFFVDTKEQMDSLYSYFTCGIISNLFTYGKITNYVVKDSFKFIPLVPLDREWDNVRFLEYIGLK